MGNRQIESKHWGKITVNWEFCNYLKHHWSMRMETFSNKDWECKRKLEVKDSNILKFFQKVENAYLLCYLIVVTDRIQNEYITSKAAYKEK